MRAYVTHGTAYHTDAACPLMRSGEDLWDTDDWCSGTYRREVVSREYAAACGKWPCLFCTDRRGRVFPPLYGQTFGHEPVAGYLPDYLGEWTVCARCEVRRAQTWLDRETDDVRVWRFERPVLWPCTSAVVLGLVPRKAVCHCDQPGADPYACPAELEDCTGHFSELSPHRGGA